MLGYAALRGLKAAIRDGALPGLKMATVRAVEGRNGGECLLPKVQARQRAGRQRKQVEVVGGAKRGELLEDLQSKTSRTERWTLESLPMISRSPLAFDGRDKCSDSLTIKFRS